MHDPRILDLLPPEWFEDLNLPPDVIALNEEVAQMPTLASEEELVVLKEYKVPKGIIVSSTVTNKVKWEDLALKNHDKELDKETREKDEWTKMTAFGVINNTEKGTSP